ncbi:MAG: flavin reductase family protein [Pseudorhodoplanes sp.]|uniref:flavin reductase family protein n=1 Tax=Pseudorhodoplanes sp. TaxID=1934341 RepID=UPI003D1146EA
MFYEPGKTSHGLKYSPYKACVVPRPVGWISTLSADGVHNLAPFSQFNSLTFDPPYVMFSANQTTDGARKDSCINAEQTGEFVWNMATYDLREAVNISAEQFPPDVDEFVMAGLTKTPAKLVRPAMVAESPIHFECRYYQTIRLPGNGTIGTTDVVIGRVIGVHISDDAITPEGRVDILKIRPIAKMGYYDYTSVDSLFEMVIPSKNELLKAGMEGRASA